MIIIGKTTTIININIFISKPILLLLKKLTILFIFIIKTKKCEILKYTTKKILIRLFIWFYLIVDFLKFHQSINQYSFDYFQCFCCSRSLISVTVGTITYKLIKIFVISTLILNKKIIILTSNIIINFRLWLIGKPQKGTFFNYNFIKDSKLINT